MYDKIDKGRSVMVRQVHDVRGCFLTRSGQVDIP